MIKDILKLLKVKHYIKNIVVFVPLVFSLSFKNLHQDCLAFLAFVSFCLISSAVYIINDIIDAPKDKLHPIKKERPIASGRISVKLAAIVFIVLLLVSAALALSINPLLLLSITFYLILNIFYTFYFKQLPIIDVVCIAIGFVIRVLAGCVAICVIPSPLVILLTFFTSMFFTFAKRKLEYSLIKERIKLRKSIQQYNESLLNQYVTINAVLAIAFYFTYMLDPVTVKKSEAQFLYVTAIPFTVLFFRLLFLIQTCKNVDDPATFIYKDATIKWLVVDYVITFTAVLIF